MATKPGGQPLNTLIENNFKRGMLLLPNPTDTSDTHPLKAFAIVILSIVPHAAEVERLFSDLGGTQSAKHCNLSVRTFETLGKVRANLRYHVHLKNVTDGKPTRRRHAHMHTTELPGIDTEVAKQLETDFAFVPPLSAVSSDNLEGPESISLDDIDPEFARLEDIRNTEKTMSTEFSSDWDVDRKEVLQVRAFDFAELQRVDEGLVPAAIEDEIMVMDHDANEDGTWNIDSMLLSSGLTYNYDWPDLRGEHDFRVSCVESQTTDS